MRSAALETKSVDKDIEQNRCQRQQSAEPVDQESKPKNAQDSNAPGEDQRLFLGQLTGDQRSVLGPAHDLVNVGIDVAIESIGATCGKRTAEQCGKN